MPEPLKITLKTLTPLWAGGADGTSDRLHATGIIGSLRWWYEAIVRGLGGYACDPTSDDRCEYNPKKKEPPEKQLCAACYLFGCTGWARKFRLLVLDDKGQLLQGAIEKKHTEFVLEFVELRPVQLEEKWLLIMAIKIAVKHGALGGKTTLKPQKGPMGEDYGIVEWIQAPSVQEPKDITVFLHNLRQGGNPPKYPNLKYFFFLRGAFLWRRQMNALMGLSENGQEVIDDKPYQRFLRGRRGDRTHDAISKKIFSFRSDGGRIWGYAKDGPMRDTIIEQIRQQLENGDYAVKTGEEVLNEL